MYIFCLKFFTDLADMIIFLYWFFSYQNHVEFLHCVLVYNPAANMCSSFLLRLLWQGRTQNLVHVPLEATGSSSICSIPCIHFCCVVGSDRYHSFIKRSQNYMFTEMNPAWTHHKIHSMNYAVIIVLKNQYKSCWNWLYRWKTVHHWIFSYV